MRQNARRLTLAAAIVAAGVAAPEAASATSVAYLDGKEVWVAGTDGSNKTRLSAGEGDWTAVSQNPQGWIVGVQLESGKFANFSRFTVWNPQGTIQHRGPLASGPAGPSYAYPLGLNITASGGAIIYGYSAFTYAYPVSNLRKGFYVLPSSTVVAPALGPLDIGAAQFVALTAGDRVVGTIGDRSIGVQTPDSSSSPDFLPWFGFNDNSPTSFGTLDASDDGTIVIVEVDEGQGSDAPDLERINVTRTAGTGKDYIDDCFLDIPAADQPDHPTVSPAGDLIAWAGQGGVKLTAVPNLRPSGPTTCELPAPVSTIAATGSYPSLGGFDLAGYLARRAAPTPAPAPVATPIPGGSGGPGGGAAPALTVKVTGAAPKLSTGAPATVKFIPSASGTATATITVEPKTVGQKGKAPITIASGSGKATAGKSASVKVKPSKKGKALRKKLKGKKAKLAVKINGVTATTDLKLG